MLASEIPISRASCRPRVEHDAALNDDGCETVRAHLLYVKKRVPHAIARVGARRWGTIVNAPSVVEHRNRDRRVVNRAYHKMHEISMSCVLPRVARSVHLCEAPGGFVQCVSDTMRSDEHPWTWRAVTLADGIPVAPSLLLTECGRFLYADVLQSAPEVVDQLREAFPDGVELVTADGAIEMNHDRIEEEHHALAMAESRIALQCLQRGGVFVLKVFECLLPRTRDMIAQLTRCFEGVSLMKPTSSRPTNSERYVICRGYLGSPTDDAEVVLDDAPMVQADGWRREWDAIVTRLARDQIQHLERALASV